MAVDEASLRESARRADDLVEAGRRLLRETIGRAADAGCTQSEIASLVGRSQPEVARHLRRARRTWQTCPEVAETIRRLLAEGTESDALRFLLDGVNRLPELTTKGDRHDFLATPPSTGDERWDTLLAASVAYRCRALGIVPPRWTRRDSLPRWWWPAGEQARRALVMQRTPIDFRRVGIWFDARNFESA